ncbi:MAG: hypothetical protein FWD96_05520 [Defluviitaleaceae bacterium]|nr:hypothetical protein [Defluviitaleaceae bacterium]
MRSKRGRARVVYVPERLEFSKKLMVYASAMYSATWVVSAVSWFVLGDVPQELLTYSTWLYGAGLTVYSGKSAYENKPKIECGMAVGEREERA